MVNTHFKFSIILFSLSLLSITGCAEQNMMDYVGKWVGKEVNHGDLDPDIIIEKQGEDSFFKIANSRKILSRKINLKKNIQLTLDKNLTFKAIYYEDQSQINGFVKLGDNLFPVVLSKKGNRFVGKWNISSIHYLQSGNLQLKIQEVADAEYRAYPVLGTFWCSDFEKQKNKVSFIDYKTGLFFNGQLKQSEIALDINIGNYLLTTGSYTRVEKKNKNEKRVIPISDGWKTADKSLDLKKMEDDIQSGILEGTEGVVISKNQELVYENYFGYFNSNIPHDTRSAGKSLGSAIIGAAIYHGIIESVEQKLYESLPEKYLYTVDSVKAKITIKDLLTMSSGIGVFENDYQETNDWLKTILEAPLKYNPKERTLYKSADPFLAGVYLSERLDYPMEFFVQEKLFDPLGITNYIMNTDDKGIPYFGGGIHLTPRDMLKLGQLYLNKGIWNQEQILSEHWISESFKEHTYLEDVSDKNKYGYLWWHNTYTISGTEIKSIEARGAGGQYIFVLPELESVVIITSGNYRNGKTRQPEKIMKEYILPSITVTK